MKSIDGSCLICGETVPKNRRSIKAHLSKCKRLNNLMDYRIEYSLLLLLIENQKDPDHWLVIMADPGIKMQKIDQFLRDIWLECCGHGSAFYDKSARIGKSRTTESVFCYTDSVGYIYDFGTPSYLKIKLIGEIPIRNLKGGIKLIFRNKERKHICSICKEKEAEKICPVCDDYDESFMCSDCASGKKHLCNEDFDKDIAKLIANSPRDGICGYSGCDEKKVRKYLPGSRRPTA
jgi:hypothetical protein